MSAKATHNGIPTRELGSTGERVTIVGLGGFHIGRARDAELGTRIIRTAIDEGITFMDNAWCYNGGESERIMGQALRDGYRDRVFLMTKNHGRDADTYTRQLEESLRRLQTDVIDLVQFHEIIHEGEPQRIANRGAIDAALEAREQGKIRYIGFTGHRDPRLFQQMLAIDFGWDTVQMPINILDAQYRSFAQQILPVLEQRGIGVIGMKSLAGGRIAEHTDVPVAQAIGYALSQPIDTMVLGIDSLEVLRQDLEIVRAWQPMPAEEQQELLARVARVAGTGGLEYYKRWT